jgi:hypothetical protein
MGFRDRPLVVIIEDQKNIFHYVQTIYNWSKDLVVCTNGKVILDSEKKRFSSKQGNQNHGTGKQKPCWTEWADGADSV